MIRRCPAMSLPGLYAFTRPCISMTLAGATGLHRRQATTSRKCQQHASSSSIDDCWFTCIAAPRRRAPIYKCQAAAAPPPLFTTSVMGSRLLAMLFATAGAHFAGWLHDGLTGTDFGHALLDNMPPALLWCACHWYFEFCGHEHISAAIASHGAAVLSSHEAFLHYRDCMIHSSKTA